MLVFGTPGSDEAEILAVINRAPTNPIADLRIPVRYNTDGVQLLCIQHGPKTRKPSADEPKKIVIARRNDLFPVSLTLALRKRQSHELLPFGAMRPLNRYRDMNGNKPGPFSKLARRF